VAEELLALARLLNDAWLLASANSFLNDFADPTDKDERYAQYAEQAFQWANRTGDRFLTGESLAGLARVYLIRGQASQAIDYASRALVLYEAVGSNARQADAHRLIGTGLINSGDVNAALPHLEKNLRLACLTADRERLFQAYNSLAVLYIRQGKYEEAKAMFSEAVRIARDLNQPLMLGVGLGNLAYVLTDVGELSEADHLMYEALQISDQHQVHGHLPFIVLVAAMLKAKYGEFAKAIEWIACCQAVPELRPDLRFYMQKNLAEIAEKVSPEVLAAAQERGKGLQLEAIVAEILGEENRAIDE
jgi:tetratricopeptide (TPR) repeat protein